MKRTLFFLYFFAIIALTEAQINKYGYPFYTYFDAKAYNANEQNWDIIEDEDGLIYVANNFDGVLVYDGENWSKIEIANKPEVRALAINKDKTIYVGCSNDFGYISPNLAGGMDYHSLIEHQDSTFKAFTYIFKVNIIADTVFFSSDNSLIFKYFINEDSIVKYSLPDYSLFTFGIENKILGSGYLDGLYEFCHDTVHPAVGGDFFKTKNIFSILPWKKDTLFIATGKKGLYSYNTVSGQTSPLLSVSDAYFLKDFMVYSAVQSADDFLLATIGSGLVSINPEKGITNVYDHQIGIKDHVTASVGSFRNSVWCALTLGIVRVEYNSPFRFFSKESKIEGYITDITRFDGSLFVATEIGLFYLVENENELVYFKKIDGIESQIRSISKISAKGSEYLMIGTLDGIYQLGSKTDKVRIVERNLIGIEKFANVNLEKVDNKENEIRFNVTKLFAKENSNRLTVATKSRIATLDFVNNNWYLSEVYDNLGEVNNFAEDNNGDLWAATKQNGLLVINSKTRALKKHGTEIGLPLLYSLKIFNCSYGLFCSSEIGIQKYNFEEGKFYLDSLLPEKYTNGSFGVSNILEDEKGVLYINYYSETKKGVDKIVWNEQNKKFEILNDFKRLGNEEINCFYEDGDYIWIGISDQLYNFNKKAGGNYAQPYKCLVRKVEVLDSVYFNGVFYKKTAKGLKFSKFQHEDQIPVLDYGRNDITFYYAAPYYEGNDEILYSYQLKGFKNEWSKWNKEAKAVFTNLNEGEYTFKVKARNIYELESEIGTYEFTILPPWYRTIVAYIFYILMALLSVWVIVKLYTRRLKQEKIRLEGIVRERTAEIREQRDEIAEQKQSIEDSILYARRIQRAILPSNELANEILPEHFILFRPRDIVSGDYYWMNKIGNKTIVVAADCTGHGVPGAFMSMLGVSFLNEIVLKDQIIDSHLILNNLRERVKKTLKQEGKEGEAKDGMDIALVVIDDEIKKLYFSGAYNPVYIFRNNELIEIKADRMPIGIYIKEKESFTLNEFEYKTGDTFYIFSDGYPDQFGGEHKQKFRSKALKELLASIQDKPMQEQGEILNNTIVDWMGDDQEQIDDMVVIGVRLK